MQSNFYIITGGPGMGKTSIIEQLKKQGFTCVNETGRTIIREQTILKGDALPWLDKLKFARMMFSQSVTDFTEVTGNNKPVFFDRGIPDIVGYIEWCNIAVPADIHDAAITNRYNETVFITPPWKEIYINDKERKQSFAEAVDTYEVMRSVYGRYGYKLVELPKGTVVERTAFILDKLYSR